MARPAKTGLDYFPLDCKDSRSFDAVKRKYGAAGFGLTIYLFRLIYSKGYFITLDDTLIEDISLDLNIDKLLTREIIDFLGVRGVFDEKLLTGKSVLTSKRIQKTFLECTKRRKCIHIADNNLVNVDINLINVDNNTVNVDKSTQRKVKESKVKNNNKKQTIKKDFVKSHKNWSLEEFLESVNQYKEKFTPGMIADFISYWSESNAKTGKMLFQRKETWETLKRLQRWQRSDYSSSKRPASNEKYNNNDWADKVTEILTPSEGY